MALCDLAARERNISVSALFGGPLRDRVFAYGSGPFITEAPDPYAHYAQEVDRCLALGYRAMKPRAGVSPGADGRMAAAMRKQVGPDIGLMVDINQAYTAPAAIASAREMAEARLLWIEEPVEPEDIPGYAAVARSASIAVAGGEALASAAAFRDFLVADTMSILQPGSHSLRRVYGLPEDRGARRCLRPACYAPCVRNHRQPTRRPCRWRRSCRPSVGSGQLPIRMWRSMCPTTPCCICRGEVRPNADGTLSVPDAPGTGLAFKEEQLGAVAARGLALQLSRSTTTKKKGRVK